MRVIDRKKNIFKLSNGEWVSPEHVEAELMSCAAVKQIFIHGDSKHSQVIALVVPSEAGATEEAILREVISLLKTAVFVLTTSYVVGEDDRDKHWPSPFSNTTRAASTGCRFRFYRRQRLTDALQQALSVENPRTPRSLY